MTTAESFLLALVLALGTMVGTVAALRCWFGWLLKRAQADENAGREPEPPAWGEPDLTPPSNSPAARAEAAELDALWALPPHRAGPDRG